MSLTRDDLNQIRGIVREIVKNEVEKLAIATAKGFEEVHNKLGAHDQRFDNHDKRFDSIDKRLDSHDKRFDAVDSSHRHVMARLDTIEHDIADLRLMRKELREIRTILDEVVTRREFEKLEKRVGQIERQLGFAK